jgi:DNA invertase Pin-like site-specific DNA recombinase
MRLGYLRVSTVDQNTTRQLDGIPVDKIFEDHASGKDTNRPQLQAALEWAREGDTLVVHSMDRLARNLGDLLRIVADLTNRKVKVEFVKEGLTFTGEDSPMATLMLSIMGAVASFERSMILERQREGVALAKKAGKYHGRAPAIRSSNGKLEQLTKLTAEGKGVAEMARAVGVSRQTVYSWLKNQQKAEVAA